MFGEHAFFLMSSKIEISYKAKKRCPLKEGTPLFSNMLLLYPSNSKCQQLFFEFEKVSTKVQ